MKWIDEMGLVISSTDDINFKSELKDVKQISEDIIRNGVDYAEKYLGYEKVIIKLFKTVLEDDLVRIHPELKYNLISSTLDDENLKNFVKENINKRCLIPILIKNIEEDPDRKNKFPFEIKLELFYHTLNKIIGRNFNIRFGKTQQ